MKINGINYNEIGVYDLSITMADSFVIRDNKTCSGHGEAKLYMGPKDHMRKFYSGDANKSDFEAECIVLKKDLLQYMDTIHHEYHFPSIKYKGQGSRKNMSKLWRERKEELKGLPEVLKFKIKDQNQIIGNRGYVKTIKNPLLGAYGIIRKIALPFVSYLSVMKIKNQETNQIFFYWRLFTDFSQMAKQQYMAKKYGKKKGFLLEKARNGQSKYREGLFKQFEYCPFSKIDDMNLLIASHIKPWAVCDKTEKTDCSNGLMLSPLFDKLFDKGYISFEENGKLIISEWLSVENRNKINFEYNIEDLHLTQERQQYLDYHRKYVFQ